MFKVTFHGGRIENIEASKVVVRTYEYYFFLRVDGKYPFRIISKSIVVDLEEIK